MTIRSDIISIFYSCGYLNGYEIMNGDIAYEFLVGIFGKLQKISDARQKNGTYKCQLAIKI